MAITVTFNGQDYVIPSPGEADWAVTLNEYLVALSSATGQQNAAFTGSGGTPSASFDGGLTSPNIRLVPREDVPTAGEVGDVYVSTQGVIYLCTVAGSPGTWTPANALPVFSTGGAPGNQTINAYMGLLGIADGTMSTTITNNLVSEGDVILIGPKDNSIVTISLVAVGNGYFTVFTASAPSGFDATYAWHLFKSL